MSRKWSRMVQKNSEQVNKHRAKYGKKTAVKTTIGGMDEYKGRSIFLPILFASIATIFLFSYSGPEAERNGMYWFTLIAYYVMALYFYFLRRPMLKVGKSELASRGFGREKYVSASAIEYIYFDKYYIAIQIRGKRRQWVYSRITNLFAISAMKERLRSFARQHAITLLEK